MRTTITLDDDVAEKLQADMRRRRTANFKETLNDVLRRGLLARRELGATRSFKVRAHTFSIADLFVEIAVKLLNRLSR